MRRGLAREMARRPQSQGTREEIALARRRYADAFALIRARHFGGKLAAADGAAFEHLSTALFSVVFPAAKSLGLDDDATALSEALEYVGAAIRRGVALDVEAPEATRVFDALVAAFDETFARAEADAPERR